VLRDEHLRLKTDVPPSSLDPARAAEPVDAEEVRRKRLLYRSKQRGWLEVDLLLGSWAAEHVPGLTTAELDEYEALLNQETIDIFQIVNGQQEPPPELQGSKILAQLQAYAAAAPFGKASVQGYEAMKDKTNLI
jgi:succinate dehydrogenase assembly factor 2